LKLVVDASVAAKWLFPEAGSREARLLLDSKFELFAPDFILVEVANILWKKTQRNEISSPDLHLEELDRLPDLFTILPSSALMNRAIILAVEIGHPVYDCLYLACAETENASLITADKALVRRASEGCLHVAVWDVGNQEIGQFLIDHTR